MISKSDLEILVDKGLISNIQSESIQSYYAPQQSSGGGFYNTIMTIGAILIGLGVLSLIALNRDGLSDIMKITVLLGSMSIVYFLGWYFKNQQKSLIGGTFLFLSGLLCGGSIFLIAQIYNLTWSNDSLLGIWIIMILPLVYLLKQKEFYYLYMILLSCLLGQFLMSHRFVSVDIRTIDVLYILFGLLLSLIGLIHTYLYKDKKLSNLYIIFGVNISMIAYMGFIIMSDIFTSSNDGTNIFHFQTGLLLAFFGLGAIYLGGYIWKKDTYFLGGFIGFLLVLLGIATINNILINYIIFISLCILLMYIGYHDQNKTIIKIANIYLYLFLLYLYSKYGRKYENKALFFLIGGVLMILLGVVFSQLNTRIGKLLLPNDRSSNDN